MKINMSQTEQSNIQQSTQGVVRRIIQLQNGNLTRVEREIYKDISLKKGAPIGLLEWLLQCTWNLNIAKRLIHEAIKEGKITKKNSKYRALE